MIRQIPKVKSFMTTNLVVVSPDMDIQEAMNLLVSKRISGVPVVRNTRIKPWTLVGMLTEKDCLSIVTNGAFYGRAGGKVLDYMTREVTSIVPDTDLFAVTDLFLRHRFRRLPVVDDNGFLVGNVSRRDVLNAVQSIWGDSPSGIPDPGYVSEELKARMATETTF